MFYFLMQRVHLLIFAIVMLSLFLSLLVIVDNYKEQSEMSNKCFSLASLAEQIYASPENTSIKYEAKINGTLSTGNYTLSISKVCSASTNAVLLEKEIAFNNTITITRSGDVVKISG